MKEKSLKVKLKEKLGRDPIIGFWRTHLKDIISYQYLNIQLDGVQKIDPEVREIIEKYLAKK